MTILNVSCGQTDLHPKALEALGTQIRGPIYYPPYWKLELETIELLQRLMGTSGEILLIAGSATYGIEAALLSLLEVGEKVLVANTGMYGQVVVDLVNIMGGEVIEIQAPPGQTISAEAIREGLINNPEVKLVAAVHCDTSTGVKSSIDEIGFILGRDFPETLFLVDAVSSIAAVEMRVDDWHIDVCCTSPQKCINGPQGLAIVSVGERAWDKINLRKTMIPTLCLDLTVWKEYHDGVRRAYQDGVWSDISTATRKAIHGPSPSYTLVAGLHAALEALFEEGLEQVYSRHAVASRAVRAGVRAMGLDVLAQEEVSAPISTRLVFPQSLDWTTLAQKAFNDHDVALASGFRIGTMGQSAMQKPVIDTLRKLEEVLIDLGYPVNSGLDAAIEVFQG